MMDRLPIKADISQQTKHIRKLRPDKRTIILWAVNLCIGLIFWITKDLSRLPIIMLIGYEIIVFVFLAFKKKLKLWALLVPISSIMVPIGYIFSGDTETNKWLKVIFPIIAFCIGILMWLLYAYVNKRDSYWIVDLLIILICVSGIFGQLLQINSSFSKSELKQEWAVTEMYVVESTRPFSTGYYIHAETDSGNTIEIIIPEKLYKRLSEGELISLTTYEGAFGIKYLKNVPQEIEHFLM